MLFAEAAGKPPPILPQMDLDRIRSILSQILGIIM
jgi:hypothetical protein